MKKVLAAFAVLAASCIGSVVYAAHDTADVDKPVVFGNIEIYGAAKLSVDMINTGSKTAGADTKLYKVSSNSSRIGFKGFEDLGDGLSAVYQLELQVNMDGTTSTVATGVTNTASGSVSTTSVNTLSLRNTYVGLKGKSWGVALLGTHDTPYKVSTGQFDAFVDTMGDYNTIIGNVNGAANFELRLKDVIAYTSPDWSGIQVSVATSLTGQESSNNVAGNPSAYSASAAYKSGPLAVALAHEIHKNGVIPGWDSTGKMKNTGTKLGAGYTIGGTKVGLVYEALKDDNADSPFTRNAMYVSVTQTIGKETLKAAYGKADDGKNPATKTGATLAVVGVDHAFSKRTTAYVLYAVVKNDADATYGPGTSGAGGAIVPGKGEDPSVVSFGINHSF